MIVLGIESSCDETSVSIVENACKILSEHTVSQIDIHNKFGGVVPEIAAREHCLSIDTAIFSAIESASLSIHDINRIAVVNGPGLISSLIVGITAAKLLSLYTGIELVSVNHLKAHICANTLNKPNNITIQEPFICLLASGGHTQLINVESYTNMTIIGGSIDDSAGEAFDKVARMLGLGYPGGTYIERLAATVNHTDIVFPRGKVGTYDFSFSGLKTAVLREVQRRQSMNDFERACIAKAFQEAVCHDLAEKTIKAACKYNYKHIVIAGGVSANSRLRELIGELTASQNISFQAPELRYCTDNGAMVASAGFLCPEIFGMDFVAFSRN